MFQRSVWSVVRHAIPTGSAACGRVNSGVACRQLSLWHDGIRPSLERIEEHTQAALSDLRACSSGRRWETAIDAAKQLNRASTKKHLLASQLVLLGAAHHNPSVLSQQGDDNVEKFAAGVELHHLFVLVHDDVMDAASLRRGMATVHKALRDSDLDLGRDPSLTLHLATIVGDAIHAKSLQTMAECTVPYNSNAALNAIVDPSYHAAVAQFEDICGWPAFERRLKSSSEPIDAMRSFMVNKGAWLRFYAPLRAGSLLTNNPSGEFDSPLLEWSQHVGFAFQALDDVADFVDDAATTGKDMLQDLVQGRLSFLLFLLRENADPDAWCELVANYGRSNAVLPLHTRRDLLKLVERLEIVDRAMESVVAELDQADAVLGRLPNGVLKEGLDAFTQGLRKHAATLAV